MLVTHLPDGSSYSEQGANSIKLTKVYIRSQSAKTGSDFIQAWAHSPVDKSLSVNPSFLLLVCIPNFNPSLCLSAHPYDRTEQSRGSNTERDPDLIPQRLAC